MATKTWTDEELNELDRLLRRRDIILLSVLIAEHGIDKYSAMLAHLSKGGRK